MEDLQEDLQDTPTQVYPTNAVDIAVGSNHCVTNHRFDAYVQLAAGRTPQLKVSRYYWELEPPVALDFVRDLSYGELEVAAKKLYFKRHNVLYALVKDLFDGEGVEEQLSRQRQPEQQAAVTAGRKPLVGPRQGRRSNGSE